MKVVNVPINKGSMPDWNKRFGDPTLINMFCGMNGNLYCTPGLKLISDIKNIRAIKLTAFNGGQIIVVTRDRVLRVALDGSISTSITIAFSGAQVQITENLVNQVGIADGKFGYVLDQNLNIITKLTPLDNNFAVVSPISVVVLDSYMIWLGANGIWQISVANQAVQYDPEGLQKIDSTLSEAKTLALNDNNIFIFGSTGIERWVPTLNTNIYFFPFQKDTNFNKDFGAISSNSVVSAIDKIYFMSSRFIPMYIDAQGVVELPMSKEVSGIAKIISQYEDLEQCVASFYSFRGNYFYHITFAKQGVSWVYNQKSNTITNSTDLVLSSAQNDEIVATSDGLFQLSIEQDYRKRTFITERMTLDNGQSTTRNLLNGIEIKLVEGYAQPIEPQEIELSLSLDSDSWLNVIKVPIGKTGARNNLYIQRTNVSFQHEVSIKIEYHGNYNLAIEKLTLTIN